MEEYLERATSARSRVNARLAYSAEKRNRSDLFEDEVNSSNLDNEPYSPSVLDRSGQSKQHRSVFMENQLDLNESEMEYYETVVNDLADKLEKMQEEKDDLQAISASLGERLQKLSQHKDEAVVRAQRELDDVRTQCQSMLDALNGQLQDAKAVGESFAQLFCFF